MEESPVFAPSREIGDPMLRTCVDKVTGQTSRQVMDHLAIEEPLEIQLTYGPLKSTADEIDLHHDAHSGRRLRPCRGLSHDRRSGPRRRRHRANFVCRRLIDRSANALLGYGCYQARLQTEYRPSGAGHACDGESGEPCSAISIRHPVAASAAKRHSLRLRTVCPRARQTISESMRKCSMVFPIAFAHRRASLIARADCMARGSSIRPGLYWRFAKM